MTREGADGDLKTAIAAIRKNAVNAVAPRDVRLKSRRIGGMLRVVRTTAQTVYQQVLRLSPASRPPNRRMPDRWQRRDGTEVKADCAVGTPERSTSG